VLVLSTACHSATGLDRDRLLQRLEKEILGHPVTGQIVYLAPQPLKGGDSVHAWRFEHNIPKDYGATLFLFVDEQPGANWEHAASYVFIDQASNRFQVEPGRTPPDNLPTFQRLN